MSRGNLDIDALIDVATANDSPTYWPDAEAALEFAENYPATFLALVQGAQAERHVIDGKRFSLNAGDRYRHVKRGSTYTLPFGHAEAMVQCEEPISDEHTLLIYIGDDGMIFARPTHEFFDGRFQPANPAIPNVGDGAQDASAKAGSGLNPKGGPA